MLFNFSIFNIPARRRFVMDWSKKLFLIALLFLGSNTAMSTSPPPPPEQTLEESLVGSSVLIAKGIRFRWIEFGDHAVGSPAREVANRDAVTEGRQWSVILEAEVVSFLHCHVPCQARKKVFITPARSGMEDILNLALNQPMIFIYGEIMSPMRSSYPPELISEWHIRPRKAAVNPWPVSERSRVESALRKMHPNWKLPASK